MVLNKKSGLSIIFSANSLYLVWIYMVPASTVPVSVSRLEALCAGSRPSETNPLPLTDSHLAPEADSTISERLRINSLEVEADAIRLRNLYASERIQSSQMLRTLDNTTIQGFPNLHVINQRIEFVAHLIEDYHRVSTAIHFIEQVKLDEETSQFSPNYFQQISVLEHKMYTFFCHLHYAIQERRSGLILPLIRPGIVVPENHAERFQRDYTIIHHVMNLFRAINVDYTIHSQIGSIEVIVNAESDIVARKRVPKARAST